LATFDLDQLRRLEGSKTGGPIASYWHSGIRQEGGGRAESQKVVRPYAAFKQLYLLKSRRVPIFNLDSWRQKWVFQTLNEYPDTGILKSSAPNKWQDTYTPAGV
jgi:hypothetical protein